MTEAVIVWWHFTKEGFVIVTPFCSLPESARGAASTQRPRRASFRGTCMVMDEAQVAPR